MRTLKGSAVAAVIVVAVMGVAVGASSGRTTIRSLVSAHTKASAAALESPGTRTIGIIISTGASENVDVWSQEVKAVIAPFGWKTEVCDGQGLQTKFESCAETFVSQKVSAIVTMGLGGPEIPTGFQEAAKAHIPVMAFGTSANPGYAKDFTGGVYADNIVTMGCATGNYIASNPTLRHQPIIGTDLSADWAGHGYVLGVKRCLAEHGLKYTDLRDTNFANLPGSITSDAQAMLQKTRGKVTFVDFCDCGPSIVEPVFAHAGRSKDVTLITRYDDPTTVNMMRAGDNILVQTTKIWQHAFDMVNAMLAHFDHGTPWPPNSKTVYDPGAGVYGIKQFPPKPATREFPLAPALKKQLKIWGKTWKLVPSSVTAP